MLVWMGSGKQQKAHHSIHYLRLKNLDSIKPPFSKLSGLKLRHHLTHHHSMHITFTNEMICISSFSQQHRRAATKNNADFVASLHHCWAKAHISCFCHEERPL